MIVKVWLAPWMTVVVPGLIVPCGAWVTVMVKLGAEVTVSDVSVELTLVEALSDTWRRNVQTPMVVVPGKV